MNLTFDDPHKAGNCRRRLANTGIVNEEHTWDS